MEYGGYSCNEWVYPNHRANNWRHQIELVQLRNSFACLQLLLEITSLATILWKSADNIPAPDLFRLLPVYVEKTQANGALRWIRGHRRLMQPVRHHFECLMP